MKKSETHDPKSVALNKILMHQNTAMTYEIAEIKKVIQGLLVDIKNYQGLVDEEINKKDETIKKLKEQLRMKLSKKPWK